MKTEAAESLTETEKLVSALMPERAGLLRRIVHLWSAREGSYFRVNFCDPERQNYIIQSEFIVVTNGRAEVMGATSSS